MTVEAASFTSLFIATVLPSFLLLPFVSELVQPKPLRWGVKFLLSLSLGVPLSLVLFSLWARLLPDYRISYPLSLASCFALSLPAIFRRKGLDIKFGPADLIAPLSALLFFLLCLSFRTQWAAIYWENSPQKLGVEKLYDLSLQQSFLAGHNWPPENLWLSPEPITYYILPRALLGLSSWIAKTLFQVATAGPALFVIGDAFYLSLAITTLALWCSILLAELPGSGRTKLFAILFVCCAVTFGAPLTVEYHSLLALAAHKGVDWWGFQSGIVPYTVFHYPFALLLLGDSHSFVQVLPFVVNFFGIAILTAALPFSVPRIIAFGVLATAVTMSHLGSAISMLFVIGTISLGFLLLKGTETTSVKSYLFRFGSASMLTFVTYLPNLLCGHPYTEITWRWVPTPIASPILSFLDIHAAIFLMLALTTYSLLKEQLSRTRSIAVLLSVTIFLIGWILLSRPTAALICALIVSLMFHVRRRPSSIICLTALGAIGGLLLWLLPEITVGDFSFDSRTDWMRFNLAMRLWLESWFIFPLFLLPSFYRIFEKTPARIFTVLFSAAAILCCAPQIKDRLGRSSLASTVDGSKFLLIDAPADWEIVQFLAPLNERMVLGEMCGIDQSPLTPASFGPAGRISAFSGKPTVCGWARHSWMFHHRYTLSAHSNEYVWPYLLTYAKNFEIIMKAEDPSVIKAAPLHFLKELGVTHLIIGTLEQQAYSSIDLDRIAEKVDGRIIFRTSDGHHGVIQLQKDNG